MGFDVNAGNFKESSCTPLVKVCNGIELETFPQFAITRNIGRAKSNPVPAAAVTKLPVSLRTRLAAKLPPRPLAFMGGSSSANRFWSIVRPQS